MAKSGYKYHYDTIEIEDEDTGLWYEFDVEVRVFIQEPWGGSAHTCDNPYDYYGYTEVDSWEIEEVNCYNENGLEYKVDQADIPKVVFDNLELAIDELNFED